MAKQADTTTTRFEELSTARAQGGSGPSKRAGGSKLASVVADRMVAEIASQGWPVGSVMGSEPELLEHYGVSRAVFREAVRLLEHLHVARMRRGPGGGLVVLPPTADSVTDAVSIYLFYVGAEVDEVFEARLVLEEMAVELATERLEERHIAELRSLVEREREGAVANLRDLHNLVARAAADPALEFFVDLLNSVTMLYLPSTTKPTRATRTDSVHAHAGIVDAIVAGDAAGARRRMRRHLEAEADFLRARRPSLRRLADLPDAIRRSDKRAERTAREIFRTVTAEGWPVGTLLGSEAELMERYHVSRAVLREAVRVLEHHQVARMRRGPGGGLFVAEPGAEAVTEAIALQIDRLGIQPSHLFEVRGCLEMAGLDLVLAGLDPEGIAELEAALEAEREATVSDFATMGHDLHGVLSHVAGNRVIELLTLVLVRLTRLRSAAPPGAPVTLPTGEVMRVHQRIVEAIVAGDGDLARHRMRRHLDALVHWTR